MLALLCLFFQPEWIRGWFPTLFFEGPSEEELQPRSDPLPVSHKVKIFGSYLFMMEEVSLI
ncbi:MAG: hypothetical protein A3E88_04450 [Legionellales bacterium RIFCSPHIGHO2_12_FULL_35_11]|nr:MAG: hypothetical protein A3E88_04450 [Legionellales bacterium RIFCSPHIGHO2_12_FULL_35_11]